MITPELLQSIAAAIKTQTLGEPLAALLRSQYPGIHFTYCLEDDIANQEPMLACGTFNLYLVDGREHCLCLTNNYQHASGVVIAEVIPE